MVMRLLVVFLVCFGGVFFLTSCKEKPVSEKNIEHFSVKKVSGPLSDREIGICFSALGLSYDRFSIMIPERCGIMFSTEKFENGHSVDSGFAVTNYVNKGLQVFMLCRRQEGSEVKFSLHFPSGSSSFSVADLEESSGKTWGVIPVGKLSKEEKQPIFFFAANANTSGIEGFGYNEADFDVDYFAKKYEFAMVIYASIKQ